MEDGRQAVLAVEARFPDAVTGHGNYRDQHWVEVSPERLPEVCRWLRDDPSMEFEFLVDATAVHWPGRPQAFELVYHLYSFARNDRLRIKARAAEGQAVPTLCGVWRAAEWNEREVFDMFGIRFADHPDLRRILMPDDYTEHPLRKELPLYRG